MKIFGYILLAIIIIGAVFCLTALIVATVNNVGFVEQIQNWFGIAKETVDSIPKDDTMATSLFMNMFKL